jgi:hypothetical protein
MLALFWGCKRSPWPFLPISSYCHSNERRFTLLAYYNTAGSNCRDIITQILELALMQNADLAAASACRHCGLDLATRSGRTMRRHEQGMCMRSSRPMKRRVALVAEVEVIMFCQSPSLHTSLLFGMLQHLTPCFCRATPRGRAAVEKGSLEGCCQTMNWGGSARDHGWWARHP